MIFKKKLNSRPSSTLSISILSFSNKVLLQCKSINSTILLDTDCKLFLTGYLELRSWTKEQCVRSVSEECFGILYTHFSQLRRPSPLSFQFNLLFFWFCFICNRSFVIDKLRDLISREKACSLRVLDLFSNNKFIIIK